MSIDRSTKKIEVIAKNWTSFRSFVKKKYFKNIIKNKNLNNVTDLFNEANRSKEKKDIIIKMII